MIWDSNNWMDSKEYRLWYAPYNQTRKMRTIVVKIHAACASWNHWMNQFPQ